MADETTAQSAIMVYSEGLFPWWVLLLWGFLTLLLGFMFLATPGITTEVMITFMGAFWLVGGIFSLGSLAVDKTDMGWKIFLAVINIIAGAIILVQPFFATVFILFFSVVFVGFMACFIGVSHLFSAFRQKDLGNGVLGLLSLIVGVLLLVHPVLAAGLLPFLAGVFFIIAGFSALATAFMARKATTPAPA